MDHLVYIKVYSGRNNFYRFLISAFLTISGFVAKPDRIASTSLLAVIGDR